MYFLNGSFYDQKDDVTMRSQMASVFADFYMEHFEEQAIRSAIMCVDDTVMVWLHKKDELQEFLKPQQYPPEHHVCN
jgi:hypothetical protein